MRSEQVHSTTHFMNESFECIDDLTVNNESGKLDSICQTTPIVTHSRLMSKHYSNPSLCPTLLTESSISCSEFTVGESADFQTSEKELIFNTLLQEMKDWIIDQGCDFETPEAFIGSYMEIIRSKFDMPVDRFYIGYLVPVEDSAYSFKWEASDYRIERKVLRNMSRRHTQYGSDAPFNILKEKRADSVRIRATDPHIPSDCRWFQDGGYTDYFSLPITYKSEVLGGAAWSTKNPMGFPVDQINIFQKTIRAMTMAIRTLINEQVVRELTQQPKAETSEEKHGKAMKELAMISHELRTPLNGIISMAQLIQKDGNLDENQKESLQLMKQSGEYLMSLVNNVLDCAKLQTLINEDGKRMNKDMFTIQPIRLRDTLQLVVHNMSIQCRERQLRIEVAYIGQANDPDLTVQTDGNRLQQILHNLLGNAVKFSKDGGIVEIRVSATDDLLQFFVKDYGAGIRQENLYSIFEPFSQVKCPEHNVFGGTGLGLTLTKMLITCLGGTLTADSIYGEWTEFTVKLPLNQSASEALDVVATNTFIQQRISDPLFKEEVYPNLRVLIADDSTINQKVLRTMLQQLGISHVDDARDGREAVQKATSQSYDVILMDVEMPVMNGIAAMKQILSVQTRNDSQRVPQFAFATAHKSLNFYKEEMKGLSCSHFLSKPFYLQQIDDLIFELISCRDFIA
jgi:signal transduction histidine kinase/ActR/RegA family two-component response regulator